ncbi:hypothetical protein RI129_008053 [Pyrocoelia pectoralis]|uniref:Radial spoke head 1 homolog n=1 Tax=Pyrocoelia pectoralis TaxID=417401 RepID=A0AAN7VFA1_9COLE
MSDEEEDENQGEAEVYPYGEYEGERDENLDRHGWGSALLPNGDIYEGNYSHGLRMGKGVYYFRNGARYNGEWKKGQKYGVGSFIYPDGTSYNGQWRKDMKHGYGTYNYGNGDVYEGNWFKNFRHGLGTYTYKNDNVTFYGTWKDGRMDGPGVLKYPCYCYHGQFEQNLPKGAGCFTFQNVWMQHGYYLNVRDPAFDYVGAEDLALTETEEVPEFEYRGNPRGIVPIWRARSVTAFNQDLLPLSPVPLPVKDSQDTLIDIMEYLEKQYKYTAGESGDVDQNIV